MKKITIFYFIFLLNNNTENYYLNNLKNKIINNKLISGSIFLGFFILIYIKNEKKDKFQKNEKMGEFQIINNFKEKISNLININEKIKIFIEFSKIEINDFLLLKKELDTFKNSIIEELKNENDKVDIVLSNYFDFNTIKLFFLINNNDKKYEEAMDPNKDFNLKNLDIKLNQFIIKTNENKTLNLNEINDLLKIFNIETDNQNLFNFIKEKKAKIEAKNIIKYLLNI